MSDKNFKIYSHISPSGKWYIGQTCQSTQLRWGKSGKRYLETRKDGSYLHPAFAKAILKYGWDKFEHKILFENLSLMEANMIEEDLVYYYRKQGLSYNLCDGGNGARGWKCSTETRNKMSKSAWKRKGVIKLSETGEVIQRFNSISDAAKQLGVDRNTISAWCNGKKTYLSGDYIWRFDG